MNSYGTNGHDLWHPRGRVTPLTRARRVALYSHDTQGLGHVRRNCLIAAALVAAHPETNVLLLTGTPEATALPLPPRTDVVTIPSVTKARSGQYSARAMTTPLSDVVAIREAVLSAALGSFAPNLFIVDKVARGFQGELDRPLRQLRETYGTKTVLGLRDVLDDVESSARDWEETATYDALDQLYDQVWVYGDPVVFDPAVEYGWPETVTSKLRYTGYLARGRGDLVGTSGTSRAVEVDAIERPFVLGMVGGGQDGAELAAAFANTPFPAGHVGVLITGPYINDELLRELAPMAWARDDLHVMRFVSDVLPFVNRAAATVSMGGYNSVCEVLATGKPALLVPRTVPRLEQTIRAERLAGVDLVDVVDAAAATPGRLGQWLAAAVHRGPRENASIDLDGFSRLPDLASRVVSDPASRSAGASHVAI